MSPMHGTSERLVARRVLFALPFVAVCVLLAGCFESSDELTDKGARMVNLRRDYTAGRELFEKAIAKDATNARAHKNLATCLLREQKTDEAMVHLRKAVDLKPDFGEAHVNLSVLYYHRRDAEKALEHLDRALAVGYPVDVEFRQALQKFR